MAKQTPRERMKARQAGDYEVPIRKQGNKKKPVPIWVGGPISRK